MSELESTQKHCPECGVELDSESPDQPCPACLMKLGESRRRRARAGSSDQTAV